MTPAQFILTQAAREASITPEMQARFSDPRNIALMHMAMGLVTEAGEMMDMLKKAFIYGKPIDTVNAVEELGDSLWYMAGMCRLLNVSFEEVMGINDAKLALRYGPVFTEAKAITRDLVAERALLQGDCETPADMDDYDDICDDPTEVWEGV